MEQVGQIRLDHLSQIEQSLETAIRAEAGKCVLLVAFMLVFSTSFLVTSLTLWRMWFEKPLQMIQRSIAKFEQGELDLELPSQSNEDFGPISTSLSNACHTWGQVTDELNRLIDAAKRGDLAYRCSVTNFTGQHASTVDSLNSLVSLLTAFDLELNTVARRCHRVTLLLASRDCTAAIFAPCNLDSTMGCARSIAFCPRFNIAP